MYAMIISSSRTCWLLNNQYFPDLSVKDVNCIFNFGSESVEVKDTHGHCLNSTILTGLWWIRVWNGALSNSCIAQV